MTDPITHKIQQWLDTNGTRFISTIELWWGDNYLSLTPEEACKLAIEIIRALKEIERSNNVEHK